MSELNLYPITGLYQEVYNPDLLSMSEPLGAESGIGMECHTISTVDKDSKI